MHRLKQAECRLSLLTAAGRWLKARALLLVVRSSPVLAESVANSPPNRPARPKRSPALHATAAQLCWLVARDRLAGRILLDFRQHLAFRPELIAGAVGPEVRPPTRVAELPRPPIVRQGRLPLRDERAEVLILFIHPDQRLPVATVLATVCTPT